MSEEIEIECPFFQNKEHNRNHESPQIFLLGEMIKKKLKINI